MHKVAGALALTALVAVVGPAAAEELTLTQRQVDVSGPLNVGAATKVADKLVGLDSQADAPIHLLITTTSGTAQGVMVVADTIRSLQSPVVAVVMTQIHGAGAALAPFADRVVLYPSAGLVFTEVEYEGVKPPAPPKEGEEVKPLEPGERLLQQVRERFLARFNERLAARIGWKPDAFAKALAEGGLVLDAEEAVKRKVAQALVERIAFLPLPEVKEEVKVVTTEKKERLVGEEAAPAPPAARR